MPDYSQQIRELDELILASVTQVSVDGTSTTLDIESARRERARLLALDTSGQFGETRRKFSTIRVDNLW